MKKQIALAEKARDFGIAPIEAIGLLLVLSFSFGLAYDGLFEKQDYLLPTYDNSMLHAGRAREVIETGHWAEKELVFGGNTTSYHLPAYPAIVAAVSLATGLNWVWAIKIIALLFSLLLPIGFYLFAKHASGGNWIAGVAAAFLALNSVNLMTWGTRTTPISLGVLLVPFLLYFVLKRMHLTAAATAVIIALDHQPSLLVAVLSLFIYAAITAVSEVTKAISETDYNPFKNLRNELELAKRALPKWDWAANFAGLAAFATYMAWHIRQTGLSCLDFKCLPQLGAREFGKSIELQTYFARFPQLFAILGVIWVAVDSKIGFREKLLLYSWLAATVILVKNDVLFGGSGGVFTERFVTYLDGSVAVFGGIAVGAIAYLLSGEAARESKATSAKSQKPPAA